MSDNWLSRIKRFDRRIIMQAIAHIINALGFSMSYPFLSIYLHTERNYSMSVVGVVFLILGVARTIGPLVSGALCDRFGRRRILIAAPAGNIIFNLALAYSIYRESSLPIMVIFLFVIYFASSFYLAAAETIITDITPPALHSEAYSLIRIAQNIGWMIGPAIGAWLVKTPYSLFFCLTAVAMTFVLLISIVYSPETMNPPEPGEHDEAQSSLGLVFNHKRFVFFNILFLLILMVSSQLVSTLSVYVTTDLQISRGTLGNAYALNGLIIILLQAPVIAFLARVSFAARLAAGALFYAVGYTGMAFISGPLGLYICMTILTFGEILVMHTTMIATARYAPKHAIGRFFGMLGLTRGIGLTVGPFIGSFAYDHFVKDSLLGSSAGSLAMWGSLSLTSFVAAILFMTAKHPELRNSVDDPPPDM